MIILGIECSTQRGSVSLSIDGESHTNLDWEKKNSHGELVAPAINECLCTNKLVAQDIDLIAVSTGPGSFTGIRVGIATAKSLAFAIDKPIFNVNSLRLLGESAKVDTDLLVCVQNAYSNLHFFAEYRVSKETFFELTPPSLRSNNDFLKNSSSKFTLIGDFSFLDDESLKSIHDDPRIDKGPAKHPRAQDLVNLAFHNKSKNQLTSWKDLAPLYIRPSAAEEKLKKGLLKPLN